MSIEAMKQALEALCELEHDTFHPAKVFKHKPAIAALRLAIEQAEKQEPVAWKWHQAPVKTQWGDDMVVADIAIDKDHTVSIYCERDQAAKVEAMFTPPAAQRQWVGFTEDEINEYDYEHRDFIYDIEALLKHKNTRLG
jgi:hypothetical protein